jgi:hypothetical protein
MNNSPSLSEFLNNIIQSGSSYGCTKIHDPNRCLPPCTKKIIKKYGTTKIICQDPTRFARAKLFTQQKCDTSKLDGINEKLKLAFGANNIVAAAEAMNECTEGAKCNFTGTTCRAGFIDSRLRKVKPDSSQVESLIMDKPENELAEIVDMSKKSNTGNPSSITFTELPWWIILIIIIGFVCCILCLCSSSMSLTTSRIEGMSQQSNLHHISEQINNNNNEQKRRIKYRFN